MGDVNFIVEAIDKASSVMRTIGTSVTGFNQALQVIQRALAGVAKVYDAMITKTFEYAMEVDRLSRMMGMNAEETSKLIQAADEVALSTDNIAVAMRAAISKGYEPSMESLGMMADEYNSLSTQAEKTRFLMDNFGMRAGPQLAKLLERGSAGIAKMGDEAEALGLVLSQADVDAAEEYRLAIDELGDSWAQLTTTVGTEAIPVLSDALEFFNARVREMKQMSSEILTYAETSMRARKEFLQMKGDMYPDTRGWSNLNIAVLDFLIGAGEKTDDFRAGLDEAALAAAGLAEKIQAVYASEFGDENQLNFLVGYAQKYDDVQQQIADNETEIARLRKAGYTDADPEMQKLLGQQVALKGSMDEYVNTMLFGFAQAVVLADGLVTSEELAKLGGLGAELGIFSPEAWAEAEGALSGFTTDAQGIMDTALGTTAENAKATWKTAADEVTRMVQAIPDVIEVTVRKEGDEGRGGSRRGDGGDGGATGFASGGQLRSGRWSMVGERGWELISPTGFVYPHEQSKRMVGKVGSTRGFAEGGQLGESGDMSAMFDRLANKIVIGVRDAVLQVAQ